MILEILIIIGKAHDSRTNLRCSPGGIDDPLYFIDYLQTVLTFVGDAIKTRAHPYTFYWKCPLLRSFWDEVRKISQKFRFHDS